MSPHCPTCHSPLPDDTPGGLCPSCALRAALQADTDLPGSPAPPSPSIEELARCLPDLEGFDLLGRGGMGTVYRARHRRLDRAVAVKVLDADIEDEAFAERFTQEARTLAKLDHAHVVKVYDFGRRDGLFYLIMELVDGVDLRQTLRAGRLRPEEALALVPQLCEALQYAHDQGVVHRDIKPENILLDRNGVAKIADFGLAKLMDPDRGHNLTQTRQVMGTPNYMAPEQVEHPGQVDHRADIFALGVVFYELLTGELPIGRFPPPSSKVQVDARLDDVVLRTLEKEPGRRYQHARDLQTDVESFSRGGPTPLANPGGAAPSTGRTDFEYLSAQTLFGLPLIHIAFSRDSSGRRMRLASGIIAIGDMAIGAVAVGAFCFGGITFGGIGFGLMSFAGIALGVLTALGGIGIAAFSTAGFSTGFIAHGPLPLSLLSTETGLTGWDIFGWSLTGVAFLTGVTAVVYAWYQVHRVGRAD